MKLLEENIWENFKMFDLVIISWNMTPEAQAIITEE